MQHLISSHSVGGCPVHRLTGAHDDEQSANHQDFPLGFPTRIILYM